MICPKCDGELDRVIVSKWGDGQQVTPTAPYVCGCCGSFLIIDLRTQELIDPEAFSRATGHPAPISFW